MLGARCQGVSTAFATRPTSLPGDQCFLEIITIPPESSRSQDSAPHRLRQSPFKGNATLADQRRDDQRVDDIDEKAADQRHDHKGPVRRAMLLRHGGHIGDGGGG